MLLFALAILLFVAGGNLAMAQQEAEHQELSYANHAAAIAFAKKLSVEDGFDFAWVMSILAEATRRDRILEIMSATPEGTWTWPRYRRNFMDQRRIDTGLDFYHQHREDLHRAQEVFGVPVAVILAILGVETRYGKVTGGTQVVSALATLAFDYPRRSAFFTKELRQFFILAREEGFEPLEITGSYAGAMGYGQFIPSSYRAYAVDFDGDGVRDILNDPVDAIGSIANYLSEHKWKMNGLTAIPVQIDDPLGYAARWPDALDPPTSVRLKYKMKDVRPLVRVQLQCPVPPEEDLTLNEEAERWTAVDLAASPPAHATAYRQAGFEILSHLSEDMSMNIMSFPHDEERRSFEFWLGFHNFRVITRYNTSRLYALAVLQLAQRLSAESQDEAGNPQFDSPIQALACNG